MKQLVKFNKRFYDYHEFTCNPVVVIACNEGKKYIRNLYRHGEMMPCLVYEYNMASAKEIFFRLVKYTTLTLVLYAFLVLTIGCMPLPR